MTDRQSGDPPSSSDLGSPDCAYDILQILGVAIPAMCGGILFVFLRTRASIHVMPGTAVKLSGREYQISIGCEEI